jgi:hypothetical protein
MRIVKTVQRVLLREMVIFIFVGKCAYAHWCEVFWPQNFCALAEIWGPKCTYARFLDTFTRQTHALPYACRA